MSGPKVIRIVTREEMVAICEGLLARLDAAIASWIRTGKRNATISDADTAGMQERREALRALLARDRFREFQSETAREIAFLKEDAQERLERAASRAAEAVRTSRRLAGAARSLLDALERQQKDVPGQLRRRLLEDSGMAEREAAIRDAFQILTANDGIELTQEQRRLATALGEGASPVAFSNWLADQTGSDSAEVDRVEWEIAMLRLRAGAETAAKYAPRQKAMAEEPSTARRRMLADSLLVELSESVRQAEARERQAEELAGFHAELGLMSSPAAGKLRDEIDAELTKAGTAAAAGLIAEAAALIAAERHANAVASRRLAVLQGLASLGYEVAEGMSTAWVRDGKVVVRRRASPDYGVEIAGGASAERIQVRAVTLGAGDPGRNREAESTWCEEFGDLQKLVAVSGGVVKIEKATPVGEVPLKAVAGYDDYMEGLARVAPLARHRH